MKQDIAVIATIGITLLGGIVLSVIPNEKDPSDSHIQAPEKHEVIEEQKAPRDPLVNEEPKGDMDLPSSVEPQEDSDAPVKTEQPTEQQKTTNQPGTKHSPQTQPEAPQQEPARVMTKDPWTITKTITEPVYDRFTGAITGWNCEYYLEHGVIAFFHSGIKCWDKGTVLEKPYRERNFNYYSNWWK